MESFACGNRLPLWMKTYSGLANAQDKFAALTLERQTLNLIAVDNVSGVTGRQHGWQGLSWQSGDLGFCSATVRDHK
jgi:hypothetical protein